MITSARLPARQILFSIGTMGTSAQIGEILPSPKNGQFQAKTAKYINRNISENPIKIKVEDLSQTSNCTSWVV